MNELPLAEAHKVRPLLRHLAETNLVLESILAGSTPAALYVDDPGHPRAVFTAFKSRYFVAGSPGNTAFNVELHRLITEDLLPQAQADGQEAFTLHVDPPEWEAQLGVLLAGRYPLRWMREYYVCSALKADWRPLLPVGFSLQAVDRGLLAQAHLQHIDTLREETCSERTSIEDFLAHSFGFCLLKYDVLASWCLSEYNTGGRCEVGVLTADEYQRRGLATITTLALVEEAFAQGYHEVGWHCWQSNAPSRALALRAGFTKVCEYPVYTVFADLAVQLAIHGNMQRMDSNYEQALGWYERAFAAGAAPAWAYFNAARCRIQLNQPEAALACLREAIKGGFDDFERLASTPEFAPLHTLPEWQSLF